MIETTSLVIRVKGNMCFPILYALSGRSLFVEKVVLLLYVNIIDNHMQDLDFTFEGLECLGTNPYALMDVFLLIIHMYTNYLLLLLGI